MAFWQQSSPKDIVIRPVNKGIVLNRPTQTLEPEMALDAQNVHVTEVGLRRRAGLEGYAGNQSVPYRMQDMVTFWTAASLIGDTQQSMLFTDRTLFRVGPFSGFEEVRWAYDTGQVVVDGTTVTGIGTDFANNNILPGDLLRIGDDEATIRSVDGATTIELEEGEEHLDTNGYEEDYEIQRTFNQSIRQMVDYVVVDNELVMTDYRRPLIVYDHTVDAVVEDPLDFYIDNDDWKIKDGDGYPMDFIAGCITTFQDRLFVGNLIEPEDGVRRQRIRWSSVTNKRDFSDPTAYIDLPYTQGSIVRMVVLGNSLVVYLDDAIYIGMPTNNPFLPVAFQRIDTGGVGLVGMKAVMSWLDGHFFVGQDDIYFFTMQGPERLGAPIMTRTIRECFAPTRIYVVIDPEHAQMVFGFPKNDAVMEELWIFNYKSRAWSVWPMNTYMIANPIVNLQLSWDDLVAYSWNQPDPGDDPPIESDYPTWDSMFYNETRRAFYMERNSFIRRLSLVQSTDTIHLAEDEVENREIPFVFETGDYDLGDPDGVKTFLRLGIKVDFEVPPGVVTRWVVSASWNRGRNWRQLGVIRIRPNFDEGYVTFLMTSSHVRFKITSEEAVGPYTISEVVIKARERGRELHPGVQTP